MLRWHATPSPATNAFLFWFFFFFLSLLRSQRQTLAHTNKQTHIHTRTCACVCLFKRTPERERKISYVELVPGSDVLTGCSFLFPTLLAVVDSMDVVRLSVCAQAAAFQPHLIGLPAVLISVCTGVACHVYVCTRGTYLSTQSPSPPSRHPVSPLYSLRFF